MATFKSVDTNVGVISMGSSTEVELCRIDVVTGVVTSSLLPGGWTAQVQDQLVGKLLTWTSELERRQPSFLRVLMAVVDPSGAPTAGFNYTTDEAGLQVVSIYSANPNDVVMLHIPRTSESGYLIPAAAVASGADSVDAFARSQLVTLGEELGTKAKLTDIKTYTAASNGGLSLNSSNAFSTDATVPRLNAAVLPSNYEASKTKALTLNATAKFQLAEVSPASHNHDGAYAATTHNHDGAYATASHNHDAAYAAKTHTHTGYAADTHNHDGVYSPVTHEHGAYALAASVTSLGTSLDGLTDRVTALEVPGSDGGGGGGSFDPALLEPYATKTYVTGQLGSYSLTTHNHDGSYAAAGHNHDGSYAAAGHNHDGSYATTAALDLLDGRVDALEAGSGGGGSGGTFDPSVLAPYATTEYVNTGLATKAASAHNHDALYYTRAEADAAFVDETAFASLASQVNSLSSGSGGDATLAARVGALETLTASYTAPPAINPEDYVTNTSLATTLENYQTVTGLATFLTQADGDARYATTTDLATLREELLDVPPGTTTTPDTTYAMKTDLADYIRLDATRVGPEGTAGDLATMADLDTVATNLENSLGDYYLKTDADGKFATQTQVSGYVLADTSALTNYYTKTEVDTKIAAIPSGGGGGSGTSVSRVKKTFTVGTATAGYQYVTIYAIGGATALDAVTVTRHDLTWAASPPTLSATTYTTGVADAPETLTNAAILRVSNTTGVAIDRVVVTQYTTSLSKPNLIVVMDNPAGAVVAHEAQRASALFHGTAGMPTSAGINVLYTDQYGQGFAAVTPATTYPAVRIAFTAFTTGSSNIPQNLIITL